MAQPLQNPTSGAEAEEGASRLTLRLSPEARAALEKLTKLKGGTYADIIRKALGTELFLVEQNQNGSRILIEDRNKNMREIVLR